MNAPVRTDVRDVRVAPDSRPKVSIIMPVRNEESFIGRSIASVLAQDYPASHIEVLVVDGMSTDHTRTAATSALGNLIGTRARILDNPDAIAPTAMNIGIAAASGEVIVRVDGHAVLTPDYVRRCVEVLQETASQCAGGAWTQRASNRVGRAIAEAQSSRFGVGKVAFRTGRTQAGPVDTVPFGAYPRAVFDRIGSFDVELVRNQDDELNMRLRQAGGVVWYDPSIRLDYFGRSSFRRLWRQYYQYGAFKVRVAQKRGGFAAVRHVIPATFVVSAAGSILIALARRRPAWALSVLGPYAAANAVATVRAARRARVDPGLVAIAYGTLHIGYGVGFLSGLWRWRQHFRRR